MAKIIERKQHTIDATDKSLGRIATQIVCILRGKNKADFMPNIDSGDFVEVININKCKFTGKKLENKLYFKYSGYPGGMKSKKIKDIFENNSDKLLRGMVYHMLPKNKLRKGMIKRLNTK